MPWSALCSIPIFLLSLYMPSKVSGLGSYTQLPKQAKRDLSPALGQEVFPHVQTREDRRSCLKRLGDLALLVLDPLSMNFQALTQAPSRTLGQISPMHLLSNPIASSDTCAPGIMKHQCAQSTLASLKFFLCYSSFCQCFRVPFSGVNVNQKL